MTQDDRVYRERCALAHLVSTPSSIDDVFVELFMVPAHRNLFAAFRAEYERTRPAFDWIAACTAAGIRTYEVTASIINADSSASTFVLLLKEAWIHDQLTRSTRALSDHDGLDAMLTIEKDITAIRERLNLSGRRGTDFAEWLDTQARLHQTGIDHVDQLYGGFAEGENVIVAGRPGAGKTTLGTTLAANFVTRGTAVEYHSFEMVPTGIWTFLTARMSMTDNHPVTITDIRRRNFSAAQRECIVGHHTRLQADGLRVHNSAGQDVQQLAAAIETSRSPIHIVDHLGLVPVAGVHKEYEKVTAVSNTLQRAAKRSGKLVIELVQLHRGDDGKPGMEDLRGSGHLEQDADVILFIHEPDRENNRARGLTVVDAQLVIDKAREGQTGFIPIRVNRAHAYVFTNDTPQQVQAF